MVTGEAGDAIAPPDEPLLRVEFGRRPLWPERPVSLLLGVLSLFALLLAALIQLEPNASVPALSLVCVPVLVGVVLLWAVPRRWPPPALECRTHEFLAPRFLVSRRRIRVRYEELFDAVLTGSNHGLMLGVRGRLPLRYPAEGLVGSDAAARVVAGLRERIAALPDGAERIHALDERARLSRDGDARPWASWGFVALIFGAFAGHSLLGVTGSEPVLLARFGANSPLLFERGEFYRVFTANLLHADASHLYMNGMLLMLLATRLEAVLGRARTAWVLLFSAAGGALVSSYASQGLLSIGASTAVFGVIGGFVYVNVARRDQLPADLRVPAWVFVAVAALQISSEIRVANIDHLAHVGGLAAGWVAAAIAVGRDPLAQLREEPSGSVRAGLAVLSLLWLGALVWGGVRIVTPDVESQAVLTEQVFLRDAARPPVLDRLAVDWSLDPSTSREQIDIARASVERAIRRLPGDAALWDSVAVLRAVDGSREGAIIAQWNAAVIGPTPARLLKLALYERDQVAETGVMRMGLGSRVQADFGFELEGTPDAAVIDLQLSQPPVHGAVLHALVLKGEFLVGHMELWLGPTNERRLRFESEDLRATGASALEFRLALVDTRPRGVARNSVQVRFWALARGQDAEDAGVITIVR